MMLLDVLSQFLQAFLVGIAGILAAFLVGLVRAQIKRVLAKIEAEKPDLLAQLEYIAGIAVKAAEQAQLAGFVKEKRDYAFTVIEKYLADNGWQIDVDVIYAAIEAAVLEEFNKEKKLQLK